MRARSEKNLNWSLNVEIGMPAMWLQIRDCTFVLVVGLTGAVIFKNVDVGFHFFHHEIFSLTLELFKKYIFCLKFMKGYIFILMSDPEMCLQSDGPCRACEGPSIDRTARWWRALSRSSSTPGLAQAAAVYLVRPTQPMWQQQLSYPLLLLCNNKQRWLGSYWRWYVTCLRDWFMDYRIFECF